VIEGAAAPRESIRTAAPLDFDFVREVVPNIFVLATHEKISRAVCDQRRVFQSALKTKRGSFKSASCAIFNSMTRPRLEVLRLFRVAENRAGAIALHQPRDPLFQHIGRP
jgi:hypothetical protein